MAEKAYEERARSLVMVKVEPEVESARPPRQGLPSDCFFERDASHLLSAQSTHPGIASEKALLA